MSKFVNIKNSQSSRFKDSKFFSLQKKITSVSKYGKICKFGLKWTLLNPI
jgi:hypothetical protein